MMEKLTSRKLWVAVLGSAATVFAENLGLEGEAIQQIIQVVSVYILGQGAVDAMGALKGKG